MASCGSLPKGNTKNLVGFLYYITVLFIAGTTAVGKTDLSIHLAKLIDGEIISADSVQVLKYLLFITFFYSF